MESFERLKINETADRSKYILIGFLIDIQFMCFMLSAAEILKQITHWGFYPPLSYSACKTTV